MLCGGATEAEVVAAGAVPTAGFVMAFGGSGLKAGWLADVLRPPFCNEMPPPISIDDR